MARSRRPLCPPPAGTGGCLWSVGLQNVGRGVPIPGFTEQPWGVGVGVPHLEPEPCHSCSGTSGFWDLGVALAGGRVPGCLGPLLPPPASRAEHPLELRGPQGMRDEKGSAVGLPVPTSLPQFLPSPGAAETRNQRFPGIKFLFHGPGAESAPSPPHNPLNSH